MKVFLSFLFGIGIGVYGFFFYLKDKIAPKRVLSSTAVSLLSSTPPPSPTVTGIIFQVESISETPTHTPTPIQTLTITPKPTKTITPTLKLSFTPTKIITITPTSTPNTSKTPTQTPTPTINAVMYKTYTSQEINGFVDRFAGQYGVDANILRHIALCESGFNPKASNLGYAGLYQFSVSAWTTYRTKIGESVNADLRFDAEEAVQTAAYVLSIGKGSIWPNCTP